MTDKNYKILIIDDEKGLREGTARLLSMEGYEVLQAENGTEGIELGTSIDFDLAIIDLRMPDIDGLEVLRQIKAAYPSTVCFINTAFATIESAIEATKNGAFGYLSKPFTPEELLYNIVKGIRQRKILLESANLKKEREESLLELNYEKSRLRTIINSIESGVLVINKENQIVYYNGSALKNLDISEINIGDNAFDILPQKLIKMIRTYFQHEHFADMANSVQIEIKPNNLMVVEAVISAVKNDESQFSGIVITIRDITEMKKIELVKSQFVSMVAHELKTPVAAVQGFLNLLSDPTIPISEENKADYINRSRIRLSSLLDLVNDLLDISRMELKTKQRELERFDINESIVATLELLEFEISKKKISVIKKIDDNLPQIFADKNEIMRLITNLLSNAIKYNKESGSITVSATSTNNYLLLGVKDTGIGLTEENRKKLFHEFFRVRSSDTRGISGTGLGLTIVKRIVDSYHGRIFVESEYGKGTEFLIKLPLNKKTNNN